MGVLFRNYTKKLIGANMVKDPATFTIERGLLKRLENYVKKRERFFGGRRSKSSIVEEGLEKILYRLEREISGLEGKDISVIR